MSRCLSYLLGVLVLVVGLSAVACQSSSVNEHAELMTTVILVRHAEKELVGDDPVLTPEGTDRANSLAHVVGEATVSAVYTTPFNRTRNTAVPLAHVLGLDVTEVAVSQQFAAEMAEIVRNQHVGETVVIVSHSNTTPAIIGELGVTPMPIIEDDEYDDLYVVTLTSNGQASLLSLRYGSETN